jgi:hypothetical protein
LGVSLEFSYTAQELIEHYIKRTNRSVVNAAKVNEDFPLFLVWDDGKEYYQHHFAFFYSLRKACGGAVG